MRGVIKVKTEVGSREARSSVLQRGGTALTTALREVGNRVESAIAVLEEETQVTDLRAPVLAIEARIEAVEEAEEAETASGTEAPQVAEDLGTPAHSVAAPAALAVAVREAAVHAAHQASEAAVVVDGVGAAVVVVDVGDSDVSRKEKSMRSRMSHPTAKIILLLLLGILLSQAFSLPLHGQSQAAPQSASSAGSAQKVFTTPQAAAEALIEAAEKYDVDSLKQIFGPEGEDLFSSSDAVREKSRTQAFAAKAREKNVVELDPTNKSRAVLSVGDDDWPFPVPLVKKSGKWFFDTKRGHDEILFRRIGANELDAIQICHGFVEAQKEYASEVHDDSGVHQYAQKIISTPGKRDGLAWRNEDGTLGGPISENIAQALQEGYTSKAEGYHGYFFKVLKGQGPAARLGQLDYVVRGVMIGGFALVAFPVEYRVTGVKTFIVSYDGVVYEKDLGPDTLKIAQDMQLYNPDKTWHPTDDQWSTEVSSASN